MKNSIKLVVLAGVSLLAVYACKAKKAAEPVATEVKPEVKPKSICDDMTVGYTSHVKGIIDERCINCHGSNYPAAGINLTTYELVKEQAARGRFMGSLHHEMPFASMPKKSPKLSDSTLQIISCWIEKGSPL